jgi:AAA ATPase domain/AAA domain, putative AbiEii toxin, Type IV TA system
MIAPVLEQEKNRTDYRMIESLEIRNFRCYHHARVDNLNTINILVGRNASGKTAFLEALFFTLGSPEIAFRLRNWRGLGTQVQYSEASETRSGVWRDLFYNFDQSQPVKIDLIGSIDSARSVRITCSGTDTLIVKKGRASITEQVAPILFEYWQAGAKVATVKPEFAKDELILTGTPEPARGAFYPSNVPIDPGEVARHFSSLSRQHKEQPIVDALHYLYPMIADLSLELSYSQPMVYASIEGSREKIPVGLISTGVNKLFAYLVAIADFENGVVIIDEIENGFYYDTMSKVWEVLYDFCREYKVQLFASTHSSECLDVLKGVMKGHEPDFSLLRAVRQDDGCIIRQFTGDQFLAAMEEEMEVR